MKTIRYDTGNCLIQCAPTCDVNGDEVTIGFNRIKVGDAIYSISDAVTLTPADGNTAIYLHWRGGDTEPDVIIDTPNDFESLRGFVGYKLLCVLYLPSQDICHIYNLLP
jgi:hypothetical protein